MNMTPANSDQMAGWLGHGQTSQQHHRDRVAEHNARQQEILAEAEVGKAATARQPEPKSRANRKAAPRTNRRKNG